MKLDLRNAAIHYHFHTKNDLGRAVVEAEMERIRQYRSQHHLTGEEQLKSLVTVFYRSSRNSRLCLMAALMRDFTTFEPALQLDVQDLCGMIHEWVSSSLADARAKGAVRFQGQPEDRALLVLATISMSLMFELVLGPGMFERMTDLLLLDLGAAWRVKDLPADESQSTFNASFT
jgi:AcrR family transcriptional regulator